MQSVPIRIPTDSTYEGLGPQCITPKTPSTPHGPDELESDTSNRSQRSYRHSGGRARYLDASSSPAEKLSNAQLMAEHFIQENQFIKANKEFIRCVALNKILYGDGHWRLAQAFANLAHSYLTFRELPAQARQHAESAKTILLRGVDMTKSVEEKREILETLVTIYYTLGMAHLLENNGKESSLSLQKVEKILEELDELQEKSSVTLKISEKDVAVALGKACLLQKKLSSATTYFEQAVSFVVSAKGDSDPELIDLYKVLARVEQMRKKHDLAIRHLLQAHSISQAAYKKFSTESAETELLLAKAYAASTNSAYDEAAEKCFRESLNAFQAVLGPNDPQTLNTCVEFSKWLIQIGNREEAYELLRGAVSSDTDLSEPLAEVLSIMGGICLADGKIHKAYKLLKKCLEIQSTVYGPQHTKSRATQNILDMLKKDGPAFWLPSSPLEDFDDSSLQRTRSGPRSGLLTKKERKRRLGNYYPSLFAKRRRQAPDRKQRLS